MTPDRSAAAGLDERDQNRALVRTFLARFFENEITQGYDDLKALFFWLLPFLGAPNFLFPIGQMFHWNLIATIRGVEALRLATLGQKVVYLGLAMVAAGVLSAITWHSLLPDRRDGLILGAMPVRSRTVVRAKLWALALYIGILAGTTHLLAAGTWGIFLASGNSFAFALRGIVVHFVVACGASMFVLVAVTAIQGIVLTLAGPALFGRVSAAMQFALVAIVVSGFLALPTIGASTLDTLRGYGSTQQSWILFTPPMWFLGLYEWAMGTTDPALHALALRGGLALVAAIATTVLVYPLAYRRTMTSVVQGGGADGHRVRSGLLARALVAACGWQQDERGVAQFLIASFGRVERHRFVLAIALALSAAWALPTWLAVAPDVPRAPTRAFLSLPIAVMTFLLVGVRVGASLPSDLRAAWLFEVHDPRRGAIRAVMERSMFLLGVVPVVGAFGAAYWYLWGAGAAGVFVMFTGALGAFVIQVLLRRLEGVPCSRPWSPDRLKARTRWYLYVAAFIGLTTAFPAMELALVGDPFGAMIAAAAILFMAILLRIFTVRQTPIPPDDPHAQAVGELLSLN